MRSTGCYPHPQGRAFLYKGGKATVTDGPFAEAKEAVGGYWIIQVRSREEAIEWARRAPAADGEIIEVRQLWDFEEYPEDVQKTAEGFPDLPNHAPAKA